MVKMLKQVQHDGRVGIIGFTESVINGRHPELDSRFCNAAIAAVSQGTQRE
jgi:hypothetical protein